MPKRPEPYKSNKNLIVLPFMFDAETHVVKLCECGEFIYPATSRAKLCRICRVKNQRRHEKESRKRHGIK